MVQPSRASSSPSRRAMAPSWGQRRELGSEGSPRLSPMATSWGHGLGAGQVLPSLD